MQLIFLTLACDELAETKRFMPMNYFQDTVVPHFDKGGAGGI